MTWQDDARCAQPDIDRAIFFPARSDKTAIKQALDTCNDCPVKTECFEYAVENEQYGIWGGVILSLGSNPWRDARRGSRRNDVWLERDTIIERLGRGQSLTALAAEYDVSRRTLERVISDDAA